VDWINRLLRVCFEFLASMFGGAHPFFSLTVISILVGIGMLWVFGRTSNQTAILRTKKRLQAYLLELRLFGDDLSQVWQSQVNLMGANMRYFGLMMWPAVYVILPLAVVLVHLDASYGLAPLPVGEPSVITVQWVGPVTDRMEAPRLEAPPEITVETPAIRVTDTGQFSWRVRPSQPFTGSLRFTWNGETFEKTISAGDGMPYLSVRRVASIWDSFIYPGEDRVTGSPVQWIEVRYPPRAITLAGFEIHWLVWFFVISMVAGYGLKGYFKVTL
jgi:uncharacterized membrane protein (DUF106 family)